jgi:hypothetical protein
MPSLAKRMMAKTSTILKPLKVMLVQIDDSVKSASACLKTFSFAGRQGKNTF